MKTVLKIVVLLAVIAFAFGFGRCTANPQQGARQGSTAAPGTIWTCPMHPAVKLPDDVPCPICGMKLVPLDADDPGPRRIAISAAARELARIETAPVERRFVTMPVRLVGKVAFDQTRVRTIAARVAGRLDRLYVDYEGIRVSENDHLVWLYSPELFAAQQELIEARRHLDTTTEAPDSFLAQSNRRGYEAAREKLLLWGLTASQVDEIEQRGTAEEHLLIGSPTNGVVIDKPLNEGDYVKQGTTIYRIADLQQLWILLQAYEQDLPWLRYGQVASITTEAFPGEVFEGRVSFLDPIVDERTRTIAVRVNVDNSDGRLKPGMFVRATVRSRIGDDGAVLASQLAGKWISPMHPEIVKDGPGKCDVCGMDLVPAESLGYVDDPAGLDKPLVIPASAVLVTGTRAVVYVLVPGEAKPTYEGREVVLGPRAGDHYILRSGLTEDDRVVVAGAFRIDSAMQIQAKPSMMSQRGDAGTFLGEDTIEFRRSLAAIYEPYLQMTRSLADDDEAAARAAADTLRKDLSKVDPGALPHEARTLWAQERDILVIEARAAADAPGIETIRRHYEPISNSFLRLERTFRHAGEAERFEAHCPMANDNVGASWLQVGREIRNPYFGASMLACGEVRDTLPGVPITTRAVTSSVEPIYTQFFALQRALAADDFARATIAWRALPEELAQGVSAAADIAQMRADFEQVASRVLALHDERGHGGGKTFFRMHCPMAFDNRGADWLQDDRVVNNPFFGASMLRCGSVVKELPPR